LVTSFEDEDEDENEDEHLSLENRKLIQSCREEKAVAWRLPDNSYSIRRRINVFPCLYWAH
jgi:hypothetical protein